MMSSQEILILKSEIIDEEDSKVMKQKEIHW